MVRDRGAQWCGGEVGFCAQSLSLYNRLWDGVRLQDCPHVTFLFTGTFEVEVVRNKDATA